MALSAGNRLGVYEILSLLGSGGMGEVYKARDTRLDRNVAVKILAGTVAADPHFRDRFDREARAISQLTHPHICTLHDVGEHDGMAFLVMELLTGETLAERLTKGALPLDQALRVAIEITGALDAAHRRGIVHRDLKPSNVMLTKSGAKLLDFGLAKASGPAIAGAGLSMLPTTPANLTAQGTILGTFQYMAPEQLEAQEADARTDIFAFGAVLYEMLTGKKAFEGKSQASLIAAIMHATPESVSAVQPLTPAALDRIVTTCLAKDPDDRWQSARDLKRELKWVAEGGVSLDSAAVTPSSAAPRSVWSRALPWAVAGMFGVALAAALLVWSPWRSVPDARIIKLLILPAEGTTFDTIAISPDGRLIAFTAADASGKISLWVRGLDSLTAHALPATEGAAFPFWSPDSRYIGYSAHNQLRKIAASGGPPQTICAQDGTRGATWGRSGVIVFTSGSFSALLQVSAEGGEAVPVTGLDASRGEVSHRWPSFLPDGRHYLFTMRGGQRDVPGIYVGSLNSSVRTRLTGDLSNAAYATSSSGAGYLLFARGRSLLAQPFDIDHLRLSGEPVVIDDNVWHSNAWSLAAYSVSQSGVLVLDSVSRGRDVQVAWFDRTGARRGAVGEFSSSKFSLSPNGTRVALDSLDPQTGSFKLWTIDLARGMTTRFNPEAKDAEQSPVWSPDGTRIAFASGRGILDRSANGAGDESLLLKADRPSLPRDWSRDGRFLLYWRSDPKTKGDLWVLPMSEGADKRAFSAVNSQFNVNNGAFSPDGEWIAYDSDESGTREVFVQAFSKSGSAGKWQVSQGGGLHPQWRGDGRELFYLAADLSKLMVVAVTPGRSFEAEPPRPLFSGRFDTGITAQFNVTPDGQKFLISVPMPADGSSPPTVILNWTAALKK